MCAFERGSGLRKTFKNDLHESPEMHVQGGKEEGADHPYSETDFLGLAPASGPVSVAMGESPHLFVPVLL